MLSFIFPMGLCMVLCTWQLHIKYSLLPRVCLSTSVSFHQGSVKRPQQLFLKFLCQNQIVLFRDHLVRITWDVHFSIVSWSPPHNVNLNLMGCFQKPVFFKKRLLCTLNYEYPCSVQGFCFY